MVTVVNRSQQVVTRGLRPAPAYSRVVLCQLVVPPLGVGGDDWAVTPSFGILVRLLGVDLWIFPDTPGETTSGLIHVSTGTGEKVDAGTIAMTWQPVMDTSMLVNRAIIWRGYEQHFCFEMNRLYTGESRRFGVVYETVSLNRTVVLCAFHISEG